MIAEQTMKAAIRQAIDEGMTEQEIVYMAKLLAQAEIARRRDEAAHKLYSKEDQ